MINKTFKITTTAATFALLCAVVIGASSPAHAISHAYRAQLEREHKTQVQDAAAPAPYKPGHLQPIHIKKDGIDFRRSADGFAYLNDVPMAKDEDNQYATAYSQGLFTVVVYKKNGHINAIEDGKNITRLR